MSRSIWPPTRSTLIHDKGPASSHCPWLGECLTMLLKSTEPTSLLLGADWAPRWPSPSHPRGSNVKHKTSLSAIVTNALNNVIVTSSLNTKGITKSHRPSFASLEGTNDLHRYILTKYRRNNEVPSPIFCQPRGHQRWSSTSLHPHWIQREQRSPIAHPLPAWRAQTMSHEAANINKDDTTLLNHLDYTQLT